MKERKFILAVLVTTLFMPSVPQAKDAYISSVPLCSTGTGIYSEKLTRYSLVSSHSGFSLPVSPFQKTVSTRPCPRGTEIIVESGAAGMKGPLPDMSGMLGNTMFLNTHDPAIKRHAARIAVSSDPVAAAESFVYRRIHTKTTGIPLMTAAQVLESGSGDCTEHTVLTVALLRAAGIPSRAVVGIILVKKYNGDRDRFVFHMWAESYYRDRWRLVDSTRPGLKNHNRYIALALHSLRTAMPLSYLKTVSAIQNMSVTYKKGK